MEHLNAINMEHSNRILFTQIDIIFKSIVTHVRNKNHLIQDIKSLSNREITITDKSTSSLIRNEIEEQ